ncbi:hypothetical protein BAE44_0019584 [Dichanthelium oligosanthes]|uniref:Glycosyl transferase CAP10 domain-containing protein n=1 Tax=Dichanthelium oligosanthes TaxID=888268 RepID=A0A1E5V2W4_9POAL|nr:hypothetical protein BAE44_0019584 [Dichanthelium oligosanthes]
MYLETHHRVFQTRDSFKLWGIAQLLVCATWVPCHVLDLDLMFNFEDMPKLCVVDFPRPSIKFDIDWGNAHPSQTQWMAEEGNGFAKEEMSMDYV